MAAAAISSIFSSPATKSLASTQILLPSKPGFGVELNEEAFKHYPPKPWHRGFDYRVDGSVAYV